uniref:Predicted gene 10542 n=1 Tax=Mus spicilegus TaxID=10103 RepID=A0A8C6N1L0_MUSSI
RFDKMSPIWVRSLFILNVVLPPYFVAETAVAHLRRLFKVPNCEPYRSVTICLDTLNPVCGDDGKSYDNHCYFCTETFRKNLSYKHHGVCT